MICKAPNNDTCIADVCPDGWVEITQDELDAIRESRRGIPALPTVQDQLNKLDADNALTQRNLRETVMLMAEAFKVVSNNAVDLSTIPGVQKVYAVEAEAAALRSQL